MAASAISLWADSICKWFHLFLWLSFIAKWMVIDIHRTNSKDSRLLNTKRNYWLVSDVECKLFWTGSALSDLSCNKWHQYSEKFQNHDEMTHWPKAFDIQGSELSTANKSRAVVFVYRKYQPQRSPKKQVFIIMINRHINHLCTNKPISVCLESMDIDFFSLNKWFHNSVTKNKDCR